MEKPLPYPNPTSCMYCKHNHAGLQRNGGHVHVVTYINHCGYRSCSITSTRHNSRPTLRMFKYLAIAQWWWVLRPEGLQWSLYSFTRTRLVCGHASHAKTTKASHQQLMAWHNTEPKTVTFALSYPTTNVTSRLRPSPHLTSAPLPDLPFLRSHNPSHHVSIDCPGRERHSGVERVDGPTWHRPYLPNRTKSARLEWPICGRCSNAMFIHVKMERGYRVVLVT